MKNKMLIGLLSFILLVAIGVGGAWYVWEGGKDPGSADEVAVEEYRRLDIRLEGGQLTTAAATYLVQPGVGLEFHITSDIFGKVSVPTEPPQTITFTESPLVFKFNAPNKPGSYALLYLADKSETILQIGTIVVRDS